MNNSETYNCGMKLATMGDTSQFCAIMVWIMRVFLGQDERGIFILGWFTVDRFLIPPYPSLRDVQLILLIFNTQKAW